MGIFANYLKSLTNGNSALEPVLEEPGETNAVFLKTDELTPQKVDLGSLLAQTVLGFNSEFFLVEL
jgi:hypothetical protein